MNDDIRSAAKDGGIRLWQIADALGVTDSTLSRKLRHPLPDVEAAKIQEYINKMTKQED